ncbi:MAG: hypothetical protein QOH50_4759 [Kribbellaceae bacterium]|nr:hypothetical protein [Kribbellaceae bacterium]
MRFCKGKAGFKVSAVGKGIMSHAGTALRRELAAETRLMKGWTAALADTGNGSPDRKRQEPKGGSWPLA